MEQVPGVDDGTKAFADNDSYDETIKRKEGCRKIKVTGFPKSISEEMVELYFENEKRSGGGDIVNVDFKADTGEAIIEFEDSSVVQRILQKHSNSSLLLQDSRLHVTLYDPQIDKHKVFISGIAKGTSQDSLMLFFEAKCGNSPAAVIYGETPGTALLSFDSEPDIQLLRRECSSRTLEEKHLEVYEVEVTSSVKVRGCGNKATKDVLTLYFENKGRSQGGPVERVTFQERTGDFIVTFANPEDAENVCKQRGHSLNLMEISVSIYYPCLELDSSYVFTIPSMIVLKGMNKYLKKFLNENKVYHDRFSAKLKECFARVKWPKRNVDFIKLSCTVKQNDPEGRTKVDRWSERCMNAVQSICDKLKVDETFQIAKEAWETFKGRLGEITVSEPDKVSVFMNQQSQSMVVVGEEDVVLDICTQSRKLATTVEQQQEAQQQSVTKTEKVKKYQIIILRAAKFPDKFRRSSVNVEMNNNGEVVFQGPSKDVNNAIDIMVQTIDSFVKKPIPGFSKLAVDLLFTPETGNYIRKQLRSNKVTGIWNVSKHRTLELYSQNEIDLQTAEKVLTSCIKQGSIPLDPQLHDAITKGQDWTQAIAKLKQDRKNLFKIEVKMDEVFVVAVNFCYQDIVDEIQRVFDTHSLTPDFIEVDPGKFRFISMHKERDLKAIEWEFSKLAVEIQKVDGHTSKGFKVTGRKIGCTLAIQQIKKLVDGVMHKDHTLTHPNVSEFIQSPVGRHALAEKESQRKLEIPTSFANSNAPSSPEVRITGRFGPHAVAVVQGDLTNVLADAVVNPSNPMLKNESGLSAAIIEKEERTSSYLPHENVSDGSQSEWQDRGAASGATSGAHGAIQVSVIIGELVNQQVDVMVNSVQPNLKLHHGNISKAILRAGGSAIQDECQAKYPTGIDVDELAITSGGRMACRHVFHCVLPAWDGHSKTCMEYIVDKCLNEADERSLTSIAFPALGTGGLGYPVEIVAQLMFDRVTLYQRSYPRTNLTKVLLVIWQGDEEAVRGFKKVEEKVKAEVTGFRTKFC